MTDNHQAPAEESIAHDIAIRTKRAVEHGRPIFLMVYYTHESVKIAFLRLLQKAVKDVGLTTQTFDPAQRPEHGKGLLYPLLATVAGEKILALLPALPHVPEQSALDPSFLEYLNLHRDQIARDRLRFVLFLHTSEADAFIDGAGDLWDFRHHTYWLEGKHNAEASLPQLWQKGLSEIPLSEDGLANIQKHIESVCLLAEQTEDPEEKGQLYFDLSVWLTRRHLNVLGAQAALAGLDLLTRPLSGLRTDLEHELGYALQNSGNPSDALLHYERSLQLSKEMGDEERVAGTLNNISQIYVTWGRNEDALQKLDDALTIYGSTGDEFGEATTLNNIATIYKNCRRYDAAVEFLERSLTIYRRIGDQTGEARVLNNISQVLDAWERYEDALDKLEKSLNIYREIGDKFGEAVTLNNISHIYFVWERYEETLEKLEESLQICREIGNKAGEGQLLNNIAQLYQRWGRDRDALTNLNQSLAIRREIGDRPGEGLTCWNMALIYESLGDLHSAVRYSQYAAEIEEETHNPDLQKTREYLNKLKAIIFKDQAYQEKAAR